MRTGRLIESVRERYATQTEVAKYAGRSDAGLLDWERNVLDKYCANRGTVLDVGCGGGREAIALQQAGYRITAIDISEQQLQEARRKARELNLAIEFGLCDGVRFDFPDAAFDYVFVLSQVLGNVPGRASRVEFLREAKRVLKPDGTLAFSVHNREVCESAAYAEGLVMPSQSDDEDGDLVLCDVPDVPCYWHYFTEDEIVSMCGEAGFAPRVCCLAREMGQEGWDTVWVCVCQKSLGG